MYDPKYADPKSKEFVKKAEEIEGPLLVVLSKDNSDIMAIQVTKMTNGSIVVEFNVILESISNAGSNPTGIVTSLLNAVKNGTLSSLSPDPATAPQAKGVFLLCQF